MKAMQATLATTVLLALAAVTPAPLAQAAPIDRHIVTDGTWRSSASAPVGWQATGFDDSAWTFARAPYPSPGTPAGVLGEPTSAQFIWHDPAGTSNGTQGPNEAFFRYSFALAITPSSLPLLGQALISVDDDYTLWVNGTKVFENHDNGFADKVDFVDFTSALVNGTNTLAIQARDGSWDFPYDRSYERILVDARIGTVPEPLTLAVFGSGLLGLAAARSRRRGNPAALPAGGALSAA
jgi:hypothetical protein